jgi:hypothetical protein
VSGKISIKNLYDLDAKVQLEVYLREKKAAITTDRSAVDEDTVS